MARPRKRQPSETLAQFRRGKAASRNRAKIQIKGIDKNAAKIQSFANAFKNTTSVQRTQITRYLSDYISEEIGLGRKVKDPKRFTTPAAAPDGEVSVDEFAALTGIQLSETKVIKEGATTRNLGFFETKVTGLGKEEGISLGSIQIPKVSAGFGVVKQSLEAGKKEITGVNAYNLLSRSKTFENEWTRVRAQINEKFENLLVVNVIDAEKGKRVQLDFVKNPLKTFNAFDARSFTDNFKLRIKPRYKTQKDKDGNVVSREISAYRRESIPTPKLVNSFKKQDITNKIAAFHTKAFSTGLDIYFLKRLKQFEREADKKPSEQVLSALTGYAIALAREFKAGGQTPVVLRSTVQPPDMSIKPGNISVVATTKQKKAQQFISGAQLTALVKKRLGDKMPKGPRRGPPLSDDILTERTGRFRQSVRVIPNYRNSIISYFYNPLYKTFVGTERDPDRFVGETIREVVSGLYARRFNIVSV